MNMTHLKTNANNNNNNSNNYLSPNMNTGGLVSNHSSNSNNNTPVLNLNTNLANMTPNNNHIYTSIFFPDIHEADSPLNNSSQNLYKILDLWSKSANNPANAASQANSAINLSNLQTGANLQSKFFLESMLINSMAASNKSNMAAASMAAGLPSGATSAILNPYFANSNNILVSNGGSLNSSVGASSSNRGLEGLSDPFSILKENRFNHLNPLLNNVRFNNLLTVSADTNVDRKNDKPSSSSSSSSMSSQQQTPSSSSSLSPGGESSSESSENKLLGLANIALEREIN